jgi:protein-tyrosine phosphatase
VIDIHAHIIPEVDDGPGSLEVSLEMLRAAAHDGIKAVVATPHILGNLEFAREREIIRKFLDLRQRVKEEGIPVHLYLGSEIYIEPNLDLDHRIATLANNGRYFLVEFPMQGIPVFAAERFFEMMVEGKTPIIAHPERNAAILLDPKKAYEFVRRGALLQINAGSLIGRFGDRVREVAEKLLAARLVHFVATDAHDTNSRPLLLSKAYQLVAHRMGQEFARLVFQENPMRALRGERIEPPEPCVEELERWAPGGLKKWIVSWWRKGR